MARKKYLYEYNDTDCIPADLFHARTIVVSQGDGLRLRRFFVRPTDNEDRPHDVLIFTDGTCSRNGSEYAEATWQVMGTPIAGAVNIRTVRPIAGQCVVVSGDVDDGVVPTSARAKLTAVIEALRWIDPVSHNFRRIVIATDLELIVSGMSEWVWLWRNQGWCNDRGRPVQNEDLWEELISTINDTGLRYRLKFWKVPRIKGPRILS